jgi:hypothetical protein
MQQYGNYKRMHKIHPHNECGVCSEKNLSMKKATRRKAKESIAKEVLGYEQKASSAY